MKSKKPSVSSWSEWPNGRAEAERRPFAGAQVSISFDLGKLSSRVFEEEEETNVRRRPAHIRRLLLSVIGAIFVALAAPLAQAAASPLHYVALGDSYSAASGVLPLDLFAPPECLRSVRNYPHLIAADTGAQLK